MKIFQTALAALLLVTGAAELSAQSFFLRKEKGLAEVKFLPPMGGQLVQLYVDDQPAGTLPVTIYVLSGTTHKFTFSVPGEEPKTIMYPIKGDTVVPSVFTARGFPLTVNTNVPGAFLAIDGAPFSGNSASVTPGPHTLTVSAPGYDTLTVPFNQPRNPNSMSVTLIANTFPLVINTNVPGAFLAIDGQAINGNAASVAAGPHTLSVSAPGYQPLTVPFNQPRSPNTLSVTLIGLQGTISVSLDFLPKGNYKVFINNSEVRRPGAQTLPAGTYVVKILSGNFATETTVNLSSGQDLTVTPSIQWSVR